MDNDDLERAGFKKLEDKNLQSELQDYHKAIREEWGVTEENEALTEDELNLKLRRQLIQYAPDAMATIVHLAKHADSEQVRAGCAKFLVEALSGKKGLVDPESAIDKLLRKSSNASST